MKLSQYVFSHNPGTMESSLNPNQDGKGKNIHQTVVIRNMSNMYDTSDYLIYKSDGINKRTNEELGREASEMRKEIL